jgi:hypothetical protein
LAVLIQSTSAAGKSLLMDTVLALSEPGVIPYDTVRKELAL